MMNENATWKVFTLYSPNEHSSPIRWGLKHASLLWYDDLHQAQDRATISFELNDNFACKDYKSGEKEENLKVY